MPLNFSVVSHKRETATPLQVSDRANTALQRKPVNDLSTMEQMPRSRPVTDLFRELTRLSRSPVIGVSRGTSCHPPRNPSEPIWRGETAAEAGAAQSAAVKSEKRKMKCERGAGRRFFMRQESASGRRVMGRRGENRAKERVKSFEIFEAAGNDDGHGSGRSVGCRTDNQANHVTGRKAAHDERPGEDGVQRDDEGTAERRAVIEGKAWAIAKADAGVVEDDKGAGKRHGRRANKSRVKAILMPGKSAEANHEKCEVGSNSGDSSPGVDEGDGRSGGHVRTQRVMGKGHIAHGLSL